MGVVAATYARYQADNPESAHFNDDLIMWRERDDIASVLEDIFVALEVVPGIKFRGVRIEQDESRFPADFVFNDIEPSRLDLAQISFTLEMKNEHEDITLSLFLPKLIDSLFYVLNGSLYYPILQLVDRGTYVTKRTFTLKTLLMPLVFRRDHHEILENLGAAPAEDGTRPEIEEMLFTLDLFRHKVNVLAYYLAAKGLNGTLEYFDLQEDVVIVPVEDLAGIDPGVYRAFEVPETGLAVAATEEWIGESPHYRGALLATLALSMADAPRKVIEDDDIEQWKRRLGRHFTQNANGYEEKAEKILISLERILDNRTKRNLAHVRPEDKIDVYAILRWMMREYRLLSQVDTLDLRNKRIRMAEYLVNPVLRSFSDRTYRLLNSKNLTFAGLKNVFKPFVHTEGGTVRPQVNFLIKRLITSELLRYVNVVNSFDLLTALHWTVRGAQGVGERNKGEVSLKIRGHHPSYVGRVGLNAASSSDPGTSGTLVPFCAIKGQFFV